MSKSYSSKYYSEISEGSLASAAEVIPVVLSFIQPKSVIDVGCGVGTWLAVWSQQGVRDYLGLDGDYVDQKQLQIPIEHFKATDLEKEFPAARKFDLVTSLEVAEHIRHQHAAAYVSSLCGLGDVVLFSAAIPGQGGVLHVNEQYPPYWIELFSVNGFTAYDCIRNLIWTNKKIDTCYRQNILFFVRDSMKENFQAITKNAGPVLALVHPEHFQKKEEILQSYKKVVSTPFHAGWHFLKQIARFVTGKNGGR